MNGVNPDKKVYPIPGSETPGEQGIPSRSTTKVYRHRSRKRPWVLDLFCGGGGASVGLYSTGFNVIGVDISPQPEYPYKFHQRDALSLTADDFSGFSLVWASPPCQEYSTITNRARMHQGKQYPDLVDPTRDLLDKMGVPYVIENVPGSPVRKDLMLCGQMFGLPVVRHRYFEISGFTVNPPLHPNHNGTVRDGDLFQVVGGGKGGEDTVENWGKALGVGWVKERGTLTQCVPPAYSRFIGESALKSLVVQEQGIPRFQEAGYTLPAAARTWKGCPYCGHLHTRTLYIRKNLNDGKRTFRKGDDLGERYECRNCDMMFRIPGAIP